jgi:hypothetical protein
LTGGRFATSFEVVGPPSPRVVPEGGHYS